MQIAHKKLLALHVTESQSSHRGYATCQQKLEALAPVPAAGTAEVEYQVASGNVGQAIADAAEKFEADLVVLGSPTNRLTNLDLQTSNVVRVISKVNCPIFCVPCQSVPEATAQTKGAALVG
jgi:nucleotide-binding universal stress UspA family protein